LGSCTYSPLSKLSVFSILQKNLKKTIPMTTQTKQHIIQQKLPDGTLIELIKVESGTFLMGSNEQKDEQPIHEVNVPAFHIGRYPIMVQQYLAFVAATNSHAPEWLEEGSQYHIETGTDGYYKKIEAALTNDQHPIVGVSWQGATAFCEWLSQETEHTYRLPSEAEWEYAARGGRHSLGFLYAGSNKLKEVGWYNKNSHGETKPVGLKLPNELGLYDMSGNVWEWCADVWHDSYENAPKDGSAWLKGADKDIRLLRGGSWLNSSDICRVSFRGGYSAGNRDDNIGFRVARY
jgi:formylglycine-generating enzyme required for sulfatase activity